MAEQQVDIVIIGGGLTGVSLVLALQSSGYRCLLIDNKPLTQHADPHFDSRSLALSPASVRILTMLNVWQKLQAYATAIQLIHISEQYHFGVSQLYSESDAPLGHIVEMHYINQAIQQLLPPHTVLAPATVCALDWQNGVVTIDRGANKETIRAQLIVAADGTESSMRQLSGFSCQQKKYQQHGIVANIGLAKPHEGKAYERFTNEGPLALLPLQDDRMSLVWAMSPAKADKLIAMSDKEFLQALQIAFGYRLGRFIKIGKRYSYPLQQLFMPEQAKWPLVFIGNAAHTLHPVAGQGFNLGLRDVAVLAQCIVQHGLQKNMLSHYVELRKRDQQVIMHATDGLIKLFTNRLPGLGLIRSLGNLTLDNSALLKKCLIRYAQGYGGIVPDLVCEMALTSRSENEPVL